MEKTRLDEQDMQGVEGGNRIREPSDPAPWFKKVLKLQNPVRVVTMRYPSDSDIDRPTGPLPPRCPPPRPWPIKSK